MPRYVLRVRWRRWRRRRRRQRSLSTPATLCICLIKKVYILYAHERRQVGEHGGTRSPHARRTSLYRYVCAFKVGRFRIGWREFTCTRRKYANSLNSDDRQRKLYHGITVVLRNRISQTVCIRYSTDQRTVACWMCVQKIVMKWESIIIDRRLLEWNGSRTGIPISKYDPKMYSIVTHIYLSEIAIRCVSI